MVIVLLDIFSCGFEKNYHFHLTVLTGNKHGSNCWFLSVSIGLITTCNFANNSELQKNITIRIFEEYNHLLHKRQLSALKNLHDKIHEWGDSRAGVEKGGIE